MNTQRVEPQRGFTLIEVMIAMFVTAIGLLGLAKMQALAISSTQGAGSRSMVALQVGSLVSAMHANKVFWNSTSVPATFSAAGTAITDASSTLNATVPNSGCTTGACTPAQMAANDFQQWVTSMNQQFPTYSAKVDCNMTVPVSCEIYVTFVENKIAISSGSTGGTASKTESFSVFVKP